MFEKIIIMYSIIVILNPANILCIRAALNLNAQSAKGLKTMVANLITSDNMEAWQPITQTRNWLPPPPPNNTAPSPSSPSMSTSTLAMKSSSSSARIELIQKQQQFLKSYQQTTDYIPNNHRSGYNRKLNTTTSPLPSSLSSASTNIKFKPSYLLMTNTNKQLHRNPPHHHYFAKHMENVYPKIPNDIISQVQQPYMNTVTSTLQYNFHKLPADVNLHVHQPTQQHYDNINTKPELDTLNVHPQPTATMLLKDLNSFETKTNLIDSNFTNTTANNSQRAEYDKNENDVVNLNEKLVLLHKMFDNVRELYDNVKDIILSDNDNADETYSNEDDIDDDNDLTKVKSVSGRDAAQAATEKLSSLKNLPLSSTLLGEVQGHKRQIDTDTATKYSLAAQQSESQNVLTKATRSLMWNITKAKAALASSIRPATASSLPTFGTDRKIKKKFKKKFQKFLLPLVLAYKLKFLTLIPLLIGGLTLLVGTTGLAGFFFALFTAVMSLKTGAKSAIVVKKY